MPPPRVKFISDKANQSSAAVTGHSPFTKKVKIDESSYYLVMEDNTIMYYKNNVLHRDNAPAIEYPSGSKEWYKNGKLHREDGPAREMFIEETNLSILPELGEPDIGDELNSITFCAGDENSGKKIMMTFWQGNPVL